MIKIVSSSTWKTCNICGDYRRHVSLVENIGAMCSMCVSKAK